MRSLLLLLAKSMDELIKIDLAYTSAAIALEHTTVTDNMLVLADPPVRGSII